jgi:serine/threonine protein kinase
MKYCPLCLENLTDEHVTCPHDGARLIESREWAPQTIIKGKYRILEKLGEGGMGCVYKAQHLLMDEMRALKVMKPELARDAKFLRRFRQEAQISRRLRHNNIVQVDDLDQADDGSLFIAMEFVAGVTLQQLLERSGGPLPPVRALWIARGIAEALALAHSMGVVHRDIKPSNILVTLDSQNRDLPKILDFGIVAMRESSVQLSSHPLLTPHYASPEQWIGMKSTEIDGRADLYALGMTLYEMFTGQLPFDAHTREGWMRAHLDMPPAPPSQLIPALTPATDRLVLSLLAKNRDERPSSAGDVVKELQQLGAEYAWSEPTVGYSPVSPQGGTPAPPALREEAPRQKISAPPRTPPQPQGPPPTAPPLNAQEYFRSAERHGQRKNWAEAVKYYEKAARMGHSGAQLRLGLLYRDGLGVDTDEVEAFRWICAAADQNLPEAWFELARCYWEGTGTDLDKTQAMQFMESAVQHGHPQAAAVLRQWKEELRAERAAAKIRKPAPPAPAPYYVSEPWWKRAGAKYWYGVLFVAILLFSIEPVRRGIVSWLFSGESSSTKPGLVAPRQAAGRNELGPRGTMQRLVPILEDSFDRTQYWKVDTASGCKTFYENGGWVVQHDAAADSACQYIFSRTEPPAVGALVNAVRIEVTAYPEILSHPTNSEYGLLFGKATSAGAGADVHEFLFTITRAGACRLYRFGTDKAWSKVYELPPLALSALRVQAGAGAGAENVMSVDILGPEIWLGVNGKWLPKPFRHSRDVEGFAGVFVNQANDKVRFDNLQIYRTY